MGYETLAVSASEGIGKIVLNRPAVLNAMNMQMIAELDKAFTEMEQNDEVQVVIITGTGRAFSAGRDLKEVSTETHRPGGAVYGRAETISKPVIAAINGFCYTGALELMLCADLVIASESAVFADTHARYGLVQGGGGTQRLANIIGPRKAKELIFTCEPVSAAEAERIGLINKVAPPEKLMEEAEQMARKIMKNSQDSIRNSKYLVNQGVKWGKGVGLELEARAWEERHKKNKPKDGSRVEAFYTKK